MKKNRKVFNLTIVSMFAALMAIGANITAWLPFLQIGGIPITLQTFFCLLAGCVLGRRLGALSMIVYACIGLVGVPVFAGFKGGIGVIFSSTFGFVLSFIVCAYLAGVIVEKATQPTWFTFLIACMVGVVMNYVIGTNYMYVALKYFYEASDAISYATAWKIMLVYFPVDFLTSVLVVLFAPKLYKALSHSYAPSRA